MRFFYHLNNYRNVGFGVVSATGSTQTRYWACNIRKVSHGKNKFFCWEYYINQWVQCCGILFWKFRYKSRWYHKFCNSIFLFSNIKINRDLEGNLEQLLRSSFQPNYRKSCDKLGLVCKCSSLLKIWLVISTLAKVF